MSHCVILVSIIPATRPTTSRGSNTKSKLLAEHIKADIYTQAKTTLKSCISIGKLE